jgi:glycosyltransferase involved in cell wall biosynthesis
MRILRIHSWDGNLGGAEDYLRAVTPLLAARGHQTRIIEFVDRTPADPRPFEQVELVPSGGWARIRTDVFSSARIQGVIDEARREFKPDVVHLHHFDAGFTSIAHALRGLDTPLLFTAHDAELVCPISTLVKPGNVICEGGVRFRCLTTGCEVGWGGGPYNLLQRHRFDRAVAPKVQAYLCPSRSLTNYLDQNGYRPTVHVASFAQIPAEVRATPLPTPAPETPPTVGYLGRLESNKGLQFLLPAIAQAAKAIPTLRLDIAGEGSYRASLESLARDLGIADRILWRGPLRGPAKEEWFRGVHLLAVPSNVFENFPLVALEGLVRGRPVVATNVGGIPDIVEDGVTGRLAPIADAPALARAIAGSLQDLPAARALASAGRTRVLTEFTPEQHVERLLAVYAAVLAGRPLRSRMEADELRTGPVTPVPPAED